MNREKEIFGRCAFCRVCRFAALLVSVLMLSLSAQALPTSVFKSNSKLSSGKWVKIAIPQDGVYQITANELQSMGFTDITKVGVYGSGGYMLSEVLDGSTPDDLQPVPSLVTNGKLCFYARGPIHFELNGEVFTRTLNAYSTQGYYFLTQESSPTRVTTQSWSEQNGGVRRPTSYHYFYYEQELLSVLNSGKNFVDCLIPSSGVNVTYSLPGISSSRLGVCVSIGAGIKSDTSLQSSRYGVVSADVIAGGVTTAVSFDETTSHISTCGSNATYEPATALGTVTLGSASASGRLRINRPTMVNTTYKTGYFDYAIITYMRTSKLAGQSNAQMSLAYRNLVTGDTISLVGNSNVLVWNIDAPQAYALQTRMSGSTVMAKPGHTVATSRFVAFDPTQTLMNIGGYEEVENQNIHGTQVPDMIILSHPDLMSEAERLAHLHRNHDAMDVLVFTPQQVFNEFSSGTPDAMGIRLMCKMFYDRNPEKFKYLLIMGQGFYDQRNIFAVRPCSVITYESDDSGNGDKSYATDDFFGILDDNSGKDVSTGILRLGIGRITSSSLQEARNDVDKIYRYVEEPDYGSWRNNIFLAADEGDGDSHTHQAEGLAEIIGTNYHLGMSFYKDYLTMFSKLANEQSPEACRYMRESLDRGQYFASYVGHGSHTQFTKKGHLWTINDVKQNTYSNLPIFTASCCDASIFDSGTRGITEHMLHQPNGGAIAVLSSTRAVYSTGNDRLNRAFTDAMFSAGISDEMPTLGQAYMLCKQSFGVSSNRNKLMFMLFGDPALKVNYPRPLMRVTKVNGKSVTNGQATSASPLQRVTVEAEVLTPAGIVDRTFTGNATLTISTPQLFYKTLTMSSMTRAIYYPRYQLVQVEGRVEKGKFTAQAVLPRNINSCDRGDMLITVYAHKAGTDQMVSGTYDKLALAEYNASTAVEDNTAPVIEEIYMDNGETFAYTDLVDAVPVLHVEVSDNEGLNSSGSPLTGGLSLTLDGGKDSYNQVTNYCTFSNNGRHLSLAFPVKGLSFGRHELAFQVSDMAGNVTTRTVSFMVGQTTALTLRVNESMATTQATFDVSATSLPSIPELTLKVTDVKGNLVWTTTTSSFPCTWNLKGADGKRVANGVYRYYATYDTFDYYGGTAKGELVVGAP